MKKITILLSFLAITLGNSQTNLEDFEGASPTVTDTGFTSTNVVANPDSSTGSGNDRKRFRTNYKRSRERMARG